MSEKLFWEGTIIALQPRIRLLRSFDQKSHNYSGFSLLVDGNIDGNKREFLIGIGKVTQTKFGFSLGDRVSGESAPISDSRLEVVEFYKTSKLKMIKRNEVEQTNPPPWLGIPVDLAIYRNRGHRRLAINTYRKKCWNCLWGCLMPVEMIIDHWKPNIRRYRTESFCYGPKSCPYYCSGPTRKVPGRKGMTWEEEDWIDEEATTHRSPDE